MRRWLRAVVDDDDLEIDDHHAARPPSQAFSPAAFVGLSIVCPSSARRSSSHMNSMSRSALRCFAGIARYGRHGVRWMDG